jgi:hypothetical protein
MPNFAPMRLLSFVLHTVAVLLLTALTQIGGLIWLLCYLLAGRWKGKRIGRALLMFVPLYLLITAAVLPIASGYFGRTPLPVFTSPTLKPANLMYPLLNRHYVTPNTRRVLQEVADQLRQQHPNTELHYLDAGFPLFKKFPLLPHLSHTDGRKVDLAFFYLRPDGTVTNEIPSRSGYGVFEGPAENEQATAEACQGKGYWQYSYPQYLTMGSRPNLKFDALRTKRVLKLLLEQKEIGKVFLEPHLQQRLGLSAAAKIRFHGCGAVRHDDHIHMQTE